MRRTILLFACLLFSGATLVNCSGDDSSSGNVPGADGSIGTGGASGVGGSAAGKGGTTSTKDGSAPADGSNDQASPGAGGSGPTPEGGTGGSTPQTDAGQPDSGRGGGRDGGRDSAVDTDPRDANNNADAYDGALCPNDPPEDGTTCVRPAWYNQPGGTFTCPYASVTCDCRRQGGQRTWRCRTDAGAPDVVAPNDTGAPDAEIDATND